MSSTFFLISISGCLLIPKKISIPGVEKSFKAGEIISTKDEKPVSFQNLINSLDGVRVLYIGEKHTDLRHHKIQLKVIKALHKKHPDLVVGMEMFDHSYQNILDQWSSGSMDKKTFLEKGHWYANWKFDFKLYEDILEFIKNENIKLVGLNVPFNIPPKIAVGGIENLRDEEKKHLPIKIDTSNKTHRLYVKQIYKHHHVKGMDNFEYFYQTQCVWEDAMAEAIAKNLKDSFMIVLAGIGHIKGKVGIPDRVFERTAHPFKTIIPAPAGSHVKLSDADYIWVTPPS